MEHSERATEVGIVLMDCQTCPVRGTRCDDCVVTALFQVEGRSGDLLLDLAERRAVGHFVEAGLVSASAAGRLRASRTTLASRAVG